jgi:peptidoglycan/LPS O-acetylase OafA/YrhL
MAALGVFFSHMNYFAISGGLLWRLNGYGSVCVTIFFVLSGYVIAYVVDTKEKTFFLYSISRLSRLYSVVIFCLILTYFFDKFGAESNPEFYAPLPHKGDSWLGYLSAFLFVNEYQVFQFDGIAPGTNAPFWSLSFEFTYYIIAALMLFSQPIIAIIASILILIAAGKTITILMPIWFLGYFLYKKQHHFTFKYKILPILLSLITFGILIITPKLKEILRNDNFGYYFPWGSGPYNRNLLLDYIVAISFSINLLAMRNICIFINIHSYIEKLIRWLGMLTFPLYCIHLPAIYFFRAISPFELKSYLNSIYIIASVMITVIVMTPMCEKFKFNLRTLLSLSRKPA